ncbi:DUF4238 domain-containing protein [uncultured Ruegeria sp.]|uniref:DUF4238 domain-containing protein n=1 Tax=uncultured Ruegeria sp. TaxID=259304 RepID=UPI002613CE92|nr:DUF4238 domain-containing protein [uncultured Ruegeria sp.]
MSANSNQHFVPQFYLRRFSEDGSSLNLVLKSTGETLSGAPIRGQCSKRKFYGTAPHLDDFLRFLEGSVSSFLGLFAGETPRRLPDHEDVEHLLCFLTTQMHRTPRAGEVGEAFEREFDRIIRRGSPSSRGLPDHLRAKPLDHMSMCRIAVKIYPALVDMMLVRICAPKGAEFVTSDNPVILANKAGEQNRVPHAVGLSNSGLILIYPISPKYCLMFYDGGIYKTKHDRALTVFANRSDVQKINRLQYINCTSAVYFKNEVDALVDASINYFSEAPSQRIELTEYVLDEENRTQSRYRRFRDGLDEGHGKGGIIGFHHKPIEARLSTSFLSYRSRLKYEDSGTAAGYVRNRKLLDCTDEYSELLAAGKVKPFTFHEFYANAAKNDTKPNLIGE